jgi:hypothetical protein
MFTREESEAYLTALLMLSLIMKIRVAPENPTVSSLIESFILVLWIKGIKPWMKID